MPLFCPVREADWIPSWDPVEVFSASGVVEPDCAFITEDKGRQSHWFVTRFDADAGQVEMVKCTPEVTICRLTIEVHPRGDDRSHVDVTYAHTSIGSEGDKLVDSFTEEFYAEFMGSWQQMMNDYVTREG